MHGILDNAVDLQTLGMIGRQIRACSQEHYLSSIQARTTFIRCIQNTI